MMLGQKLTFILIFIYFSRNTDAVNSARKSNEDVINNLQKELEKINENTLFLEARHKQLNEENAVLK